MIEIIRKVTGLIDRRFNSCSYSTFPPKNGVYKIVLIIEKQMDDSLLQEFKNIPSVKIEHNNISPNFKSYTHQYIIYCNDKKMKFI